MDDIEAVLVNLFTRLRGDLSDDARVGLALKAQGRDMTLRVRSQQTTGDGRRPFFAIVVGRGEGGFRVTYNPGGIPSAGRRVVLVGADSADELPALVGGYVEAERRRLADFTG